MSHTSGPRERAMEAAQGSTHESNDAYTARKSQEAKDKQGQIFAQAEIINRLTQVNAALLEALEAVVEAMPDGYAAIRLEQARAAIKLARGGE